MNVLITGGAGFLGQALVRRLCERGGLCLAPGAPTPIERIVCLDATMDGRVLLQAPRVSYLSGDIARPQVLAQALSADTRIVFHLAAVVSGAAEADFDLGLRVNLDGTRAVLERARANGNAPRLVFASSVAVFGGALPAVVDDETSPTPRSSYGVQKRMAELLLGEYSRRGYLDGRAVRLPTIVVRPGAPNAAASSFASGIIREPLAGQAAICPVDAHTPLWVLSPSAAVAALLHAAELPTSAWQSATEGNALNLPGLRVSVGEMLDALRAVAGAEVSARVRFEPDERVRSIVSTWPARFATRAAEALGFRGDPDFAAIVREHMAAS